MRKVDPKVDEAIETLNMKDGPTRRTLLSGAGMVSATAAAGALLAACGSTGSPASASAKGLAGDFPKTPTWQFWFVNHVTTNSFFVPTQYGFQDAAALLHLPTPKWTGSTNSIASQMTAQINAAVSAGAAGIATTLINSTSFTAPVGSAMSAGIPVISYNADGLVSKTGVANIGCNRLCYVGQALFTSGQQLGVRIQSLVPTPGEVVIFIETPGQGNIQPRYDGAASVLTPAGYTVSEIETTTVPATILANEKAFLLAHKNVKGAFAVDSTSTSFLAQALAETGLTLPNGGFDTVPQTLTNIAGGKTDFTIYQDPYLQGFLPTLYLYLYNISGGTLPPSDTDTGLSFITKSNLAEYNLASRYQGSTTAQKVLTRPSGAIQNPIATTST
ncbi:MAG TPA: substrate-binding domain-containing protein [Streptosporangiaceae bacterium]|jgi:simple sugar transport system substrate-binding protein|nr:substrate-binding domain-containing protein [Streptosporangiaceae bacterium]